jgi:hypothetical protein
LYEIKRCVSLQSLSEGGGKLIELLEDKSTSRNIVATIFEEQAKILLKEDPKPEKQMNIQ